jgi:predicted nuclease with RNAse H fold
MQEYNRFVGLDFGGQKSGTTCIAFYEDDRIQFKQSIKGCPTDEFLINWFEQYPSVQTIFIDAPLSLPAAYIDEGDDYMYRTADKEVGGMSPMYLGAMTARAIRFKDSMEKKDLSVIETYPAQLEKLLFGRKSPKKEELPMQRVDNLSKNIGIEVSNPENRHQYDALLAWTSAWRFFKGESEEYGNEQEGLIFV